MKRIYELIEQVAPTRATVLVTGESGTGKELVANALHYNSPRASGPLVKVNCASLTETLLESELFGHEKGAFTGAVSRRKGRFEIADKGTLFLDELSEIPKTTQVKLLRVLQEQEFERVGGNETLRVDVRIIAATNADLEEAVKEGRVRKDLYYRLKVVTIHMPPLRDRPGDIPLLVRHFLEKYARENDKDIQGVDPAAMDRMSRYAWPGNVRQLENCIEHAVVMTRDGRIKPQDLPIEPDAAEKTVCEPIVRTGRALKEVEKDMIVETLRATDWNKTRAAKMLGIGTRTLYRKLKEYGIEGPG
jgi:DNA-binding NtrC family response regulator